MKFCVCCHEEELRWQVLVSAAWGWCSEGSINLPDSAAITLAAFSPPGIRIPLLWNLGNSFRSVCSVVQVESCATLERSKKKKSQLQQTLTRQFFESIVTTQHLETIVSNRTHHEAHTPQRLSAHRRPLGHRPCIDIARANAFSHLYRRYPRAVLDN